MDTEQEAWNGYEPEGKSIRMNESRYIAQNMLRHRNDRERMWIRISRLSGLCVKRISELFQSLKYQLDKGFKTDALIKSINKFRAADSTQGECKETGGGEVFRSR